MLNRHLLSVIEEDDPEVIGFNKWMDLMRESNKSHHLAFAPLFGGTIVAVA